MDQKNGENKGAAVSFLKKLAGFSLSTCISAGITFVATFINTRIFEPATLGQINLFVTVQNFLLYIVYLGLDQSYCRYYYECERIEEKKTLFQVCQWISLLAVAVIGCGVLVAWRPISVYIGGEASFIVAAALVISTFAHTAGRYLSLAQRMAQKVVAYTILVVGMSVSHKLSYSITSIVGRDYETSVVAIAASCLLLVAVFWFIERKNIRLPRGAKVERRPLAKKALIFGIPLMPISLLSWLNSSIPTLLMKNLLSYEAIGIYSNAVVLTSTINLIQSGFNTFWVPYYYENYKNGNSRIKKVHNIICFGMVAFAVLLILFKDLLFWIVGSEYKSGAVVFALLLVSPVCYTIGETTGIGISISEKSYLHSVAYMSGILTNLVLCLVLVPVFGMAGAGMAVAASAMVSLIVKTVIGEKYYSSISSYIKTAAALGILILAAIWDCFLMQGNKVLWAGGLLGSLVVLLVLYREEVRYCISLMKRILIKK